MPINNMPTPPQNQQVSQQNSQGGEQPAFPQDALVGLVKSAVQSVISDERAKSDAMARQQADEARRQATNTDMSQNPVFQTVMPVMAPLLQQVALKSDNATDMVDFYARYPEAHKYRQELEQMTAGEIGKGRPTARESLWFHFRGNPANAARLQADYDAQAKQIQQVAASLGAGQFGRGEANGPVFNADTPVQTMRDSLKGVSF